MTKPFCPNIALANVAGARVNAATLYHLHAPPKVAQRYRPKPISSHAANDQPKVKKLRGQIRRMDWGG